jgi:signal transduction histidine kinase
MQDIGNPKFDLLNRRVLVIDDNPAIHDDFRKIFASSRTDASLEKMESEFFGEPMPNPEGDFCVELDAALHCETGVDKVSAALLEGRPYAVAFVDMRMPPGWDGLTTIEKLWIVDPELQIVICSAYSDNSWTDICRRLGRSDQLLILKKPFDNAEVCQFVLALTEKWNLARRAKLKQSELASLVDLRTKALKEKDIELRQKHKLEAVGSLAGGVAHEFNNLLQTIRGYTCFVRDALPINSQPYEDLGHVIDAADRAAGIARQLLRFSRRKPPQKAHLDLIEIATETLGMIKPLLPTHIELHVDFCEPAIHVFADADLLSQSVLNLGINACDAMGTRGQLSIKVEKLTLQQNADTAVQPMLDPGEYATVSVTDTGMGIDEETMDRIFEPFFTTKEPGKGTGMGLPIVFSSMQDLGGAVTVESKVGVGSTFRLYLPISREELSPELNDSGDEKPMSHLRDTTFRSELDNNAHLTR